MSRALELAAVVLVVVATIAGGGFLTLLVGPSDALPAGVAWTSGSGSMAPAYTGGELVVYVETGSYERGDVVIWEPETVEADPPYFMHRVVDRESGGRIVTKGDALDRTDVAYHGEYAREETIVGEVVFSLNF